MRLSFPSRFRFSTSRSGVALIVTIIMLSVITFLTVAFLALSGREKDSVKTATNQTTARLGADQALERAKVDLLTGVLATRNPHVFDLLVSTNYINYAYGFQSGPPAAAQNPTNVNYTYLNGNPLNLADAQQNLANLLYDPRPPVYITNRQTPFGFDFRYYLDLNRNGRHDRTGLWPVTNEFGFNIIDTNSLIVSNFFIGDPEWIGVLERPGQPHSGSNRFTARFAYAVVPEGKTLDVNYMHNQAATRTVGEFATDGFFRNHGVGSWELNLAAFLADLNTNLWNNNPVGGTFQYNQANPLTGVGPTGFGNVGLAFDDARSILTYRYANNYNSLAGGFVMFETNLVDEYSDGNWLITTTNLPVDNDLAVRPWAGSDNTNRYFTLQDLFTKPGGQFSSRLAGASTNLSTYDQYTYYRMLAQLGTASAPEDPNKMNLNYVNVNGCSVTNFIAWTDAAAIQNYFGDPTIVPSVFFFTNAADRLLRKYSEEWRRVDYAVYTNLFRTEQPFGVANIPVVISNQFVYSPAIHRVLQVAANLWDTKPNLRKANGLPTVFRPQFSWDAVGTNVYISGFVEQVGSAFPSVTPARPILDAYPPETLIQNLGTYGPDVQIFGVPFVVGSHKGLPNFNEFQLETTFTLTRKVELIKNATQVTQTNQFFTLSLIMPSAAEFWNSYSSNYTRAVTVHVTNRTTMTLTNDLGVNFPMTFITGESFVVSNWFGYTPNNTKSFLPAMRTNVPFLPTIGYLPDRGAIGFISATNQRAFDTSQQLLMPRWGVTISNRVHAMILDQNTREIIDYVLLGNLTYTTNLTDIFVDTEAGSGDPFEQLWATNVSQTFPNNVSGRLGVMQQILISRGAQGGVDLNGGRWRSYGTFTPSSVDAAVANFNAFMNSSVPGTNTVPFTPSIQFSVPMIWQANDPLVHYLADDLFYAEKSGEVRFFDPVNPVVPIQLENIGKRNDRYRPWQTDPGAVGTDPQASDPSFKDPLVTRSDEWQFPTNALPTVGWIGRVHRGTPWQTIYLKAANIGLTNIVFTPREWTDNALFLPAAQKWASWTGNRTLWEGFYTRPVADRLLFDVFTTAVNDNASRGRLSINQTNLAAWSAVFSGVTVLSNASTELQLALGQTPFFSWTNIQPAGVYDALNPNTWSPLVHIVNGINTVRANTNYFRNGNFQSLGDILAVPQLTDESPFINRSTDFSRIRGVSDVAYEWLPQQVMSLLKLDDAPRFVVYAYGQSLQPAPDSVLVGGQYSGLCTNYAITAEVAARAVVRIEGSPNPADANQTEAQNKYPPRVIVESFNYLAPE